MASVEEAIKAYLDARTLATFAGRIYDTVAPQRTALDYVTFQVLDNRDEVTFTTTHDHHSVDVQIDGWYDDAARRRTGAIVLRAAMRDFRGTWGGCVVSRAFKVTDLNTTEPRVNGGPLPIFRNITRWSIWLTDPALVAP